MNLFTNLVVIDWIVCGLFGACLLPMSSYRDPHHGVNIGSWQMPSFKDMDSNLKNAKGLCQYWYHRKLYLIVFPVA